MLVGAQLTLCPLVSPQLAWKLDQCSARDPASCFLIQELQFEVHPLLLTRCLRFCRLRGPDQGHQSRVTRHDAQLPGHDSNKARQCQAWFTSIKLQGRRYEARIHGRRQDSDASGGRRAGWSVAIYCDATCVRDLYTKFRAWASGRLNLVSHLPLLIASCMRLYDDCEAEVFAYFYVHFTYNQRIASERLV